MRYPTAIVPSAASLILAGVLAIMLTVRGQARARPTLLIAAWAAALVIAGVVAGRSGLGTLLTAAFILQVTPSLWAAYRTARPTGVAAGTWLLILGELSCWLAFGLHASDVRLVTLGCTGVTASVLMLARIYWYRERQPAALAREVGLRRNFLRSAG